VKNLLSFHDRHFSQAGGAVSHGLTAVPVLARLLVAVEGAGGRSGIQRFQGGPGRGSSR
jgi:hypothetical protein